FWRSKAFRSARLRGSHHAREHEDRAHAPRAQKLLLTLVGRSEAMDTSSGRARVEDVTMVTYENGERVFPWPVSWSAVWVGTLSAVALALIIGLVGISVGAQR